MSCHPEPYILELYPGNEDNGCDSTDAKNVKSESQPIQEEDASESEGHDETNQESKDHKAKDQKKIYSINIYNLPPWIKWRDLKSLLISYVQDTVILHIQIWQNIITNALVSLTTQEASIDIYNNLNNLEWNGFILSVNIEDDEDGEGDGYQNYDQYQQDHDLNDPNAKLGQAVPMVPNQYMGYYPPQYLPAPPPHPQSYPQPVPQPIPQLAPPQTSGTPFSPPQYYNFIPIYPNPTAAAAAQPPPQSSNSSTSLPQVPQAIPQIPPPPGPFQHPYLSPPQQHQLPLHLQFPSHTPISRPSSKTRHHSISSPYYQHPSIHQQANPYSSGGGGLGGFGTSHYGHTRSNSASFSSYSYTTSQSPKIQPSRQINLRQLNYHDITDINDLPPDKTRLFIGNIPFESDWRDLKDFLRRAGESIIRVEIPRNNTGSKGFGIATFEDEQDAQRAIEMCNGAMFQGRPLTVRYDKYPRVKNLSISSSSTSRVTSPGKQTSLIDDVFNARDSGKENIIPEEHSAEVSFDDGEFATEARNLVESLNLNSLK